MNLSVRMIFFCWSLPRGTKQEGPSLFFWQAQQMSKWLSTCGRHNLILPWRTITLSGGLKWNCGFYMWLFSNRQSWFEEFDSCVSERVKRLFQKWCKEYHLVGKEKSWQKKQPVYLFVMNVDQDEKPTKGKKGRKIILSWTSKWQINMKTEKVNDLRMDWCSRLLQKGRK